MGKRQEMRAQRARQKKRNRILVIFGVALLALIVAFALIIPGLQRVYGTPVSGSGVIIPITPGVFNTLASGTSLGSPDAPVKMDVWEDFQCSGCEYYSNNLEPQIFQTFVETGQVYYTFHFMPFISGAAGESHQAANAAMCANAQGRFWDYHDMLFANWTGENVGDYSDSRLVGYAQQLGLDMSAFQQCFDADTYADEIKQDAQAGAVKGVPPTPGIFVNGQIVISSKGQNYIPSFDDLSNAVQAAQK